jgi:hypothetical protein
MAIGHILKALCCPPIRPQVKGKSDDILNAKNKTIRDLQIQLERIMDAYGKMTLAMQGKMGEFGIPVEELGFKLPRAAAKPQVGGPRSDT